MVGELAINLLYSFCHRSSVVNSAAGTRRVEKKGKLWADYETMRRLELVKSMRRPRQRQGWGEGGAGRGRGRGRLVERGRGQAE